MREIVDIVCAKKQKHTKKKIIKDKVGNTTTTADAATGSGFAYGTQGN